MNFFFVADHLEVIWNFGSKKMDKFDRGNRISHDGERGIYGSISMHFAGLKIRKNEIKFEPPLAEL